MKTQVIYEVSLTGDGRNFYTLYRSRISEMVCTRSFLQNLSTDFDEAVRKARLICGEDESTEDYSKRLVSDLDEVNEIIRLGTSKTVAESNGVLTFGKFKHQNLSEVFVDNKKYVEWIAKGGNVKDEKENFWYQTIDEDRPIRQHAIALLIGAGDWIERNGLFMPLSKAQRLDYLDSLTPNPSIVDGKRVKGLVVRLLSKPFFVDNEFGGKFVYKLVDENDHIYYASSSNLDREIIRNDDFANTWYKIDFTPSLYQGKVYIKRVSFVESPISDINEYLCREENNLTSKKQHQADKFTKKDERMLEVASRALDLRKIGNFDLK